MTAWWDGRAVGFDTETDGKDPTDARLIQWCVARIRPGEAAAWTELVKTERPVPAEATGVHGISTELADKDGLDREVAVAAIAARLAEATGTFADGCPPVVAHNAAYDLTVLDREMRRTGVGSLGHENGKVRIRVDGREIGSFHVIDTMVIDKYIDRYRKGPPEGGRNTLTVACAFYRVPMPDGAAHNAEADTLGAARLAWAIARRCSLNSAALFELYRDRKFPQNLVRDFYTLGTLTVPQLHMAQKKWAAEQAVGLRQYFTERPDKGDAATVTGEWPLHPYTE